MHAALADSALQSSPKWKVMQSAQPEEVLEDEAKIGKVTRSDKKVNRNIKKFSFS